VDKVGARRCFWGTDITRLMDHGLTYKETIEHFTEHMGFSAEELKWIMGLGICECLEWPATGTMASTSNQKAASYT
jgi:hypothetical protein